MNIIVKAAHCIRKDVYLRQRITETLVGAVLSKPSLKKLAFEALCSNRDFEYWNEYEDLIHENIFDSIYPLCTEHDMKVLEICLLAGRTSREFRSEVALVVEPCMKVSALKSSLKAKPWIPEDSLRLVREEGSCPLEDENSTLDDCGIEDGDSILVCMDGSYPVGIVDIDPLDDEEFVIPISSCFEKVGDLKKKIHQKTGKDPGDLTMCFQNLDVGKDDDVALLAYGIVKQYWNMQEGRVNEKSSKYWNMQEWGMKEESNRIMILSESSNFSSDLAKYATKSQVNTGTCRNGACRKSQIVF